MNYIIFIEKINVMPFRFVALWLILKNLHTMIAFVMTTTIATLQKQQNFKNKNQILKFY